MANENVAAPAAVVSDVGSSNVSVPSVDKLNAMPEDNRPLMSVDDSLMEHFKDAPLDETPAKKSQDNPAPSKKEPAKEAPKAQEMPRETSKEKELPEGKIVDPDTIKPGKELKGDALTGWNNLKTVSKRTYEENKKLNQRVKDLEAVVSQKDGLTKKEVEALKTQLQELRPFREMVDLQQDPDFKKSYDEPIASAQKAIHKILKDLGTKEEILAHIDFSNPTQVDKVVAAMEESGNKSLARRVLAHADEIQKLSDKRSEALSNAKNKYEEFSKNRQQTESARRTEEEAIANQVIEESAAALDENKNPLFPFLAEKEIPVDATREQAAQIEKHNQGAQHLRGQITKLLGQNDPKDRALNAARAVIGAVRDIQYRTAMVKIGELQEELGRISATTTEKKPSGAAKTNEKEPETIDEALDAEFPQHARR